MELKDAAPIDGPASIASFRMVLPLVRPAPRRIGISRYPNLETTCGFPLSSRQRIDRDVTLGVQQFTRPVVSDLECRALSMTLAMIPCWHCICVSRARWCAVPTAGA